MVAWKLRRNRSTLSQSFAYGSVQWVSSRFQARRLRSDAFTSTSAEVIAVIAGCLWVGEKLFLDGIGLKFIEEAHDENVNCSEWLAVCFRQPGRDVSTFRDEYAHNWMVAGRGRS